MKYLFITRFERDRTISGLFVVNKCLQLWNKSQGLDGEAVSSDFENCKHWTCKQETRKQKRDKTRTRSFWKRHDEEITTASPRGFECPSAGVEIIIFGRFAHDLQRSARALSVRSDASRTAVRTRVTAERTFRTRTESDRNYGQDDAY